MFTPLTFIIILLLGLAATIFVGRRYPGYEKWPAGVAVLSALLLWLLARPALPLSGGEGWYVGNVRLAPWMWRIDDAAWQMGAALLLLAAVVILSSDDVEEHEHRSVVSIPLFSVAMAIAGLNVFWANSTSALLLSWTILSISWFVGLMPAATGEARRQPWRRLGAGWLSLLLLWLAAATLPQATGLNMEGWPVLTRSLLLAASVVQLGAFPFHWWRPETNRLPGGAAALLHTVPTAAGALLLARLETGEGTGLSFALPLTLLGLSGLVMAAGTAAGPAPLNTGERRQRVASRLVIAHAGIILLVGIWAGPEAVLAETRVLLLAGGLLFLARGSNNIVVRAAPVLAIFAFAAAPLTAGFTGRALLYSAWLTRGRWILVVATTLLYLPLLATAFLLLRTKEDDTPSERAGQLLAPSLLLLALGLFSLAAVGETSPLAWIAILVPAAGALLLVRLGEAVAELPHALRDVLVFPWSLPHPSARLRSGVDFVGQALRQTISILEGEGGLLWLFLFLMIVWLVG